MKILKVNANSPEKEIIKKAVKILELGGVIVYPTETLYGLGANPFNQQGLYRVFEIKGRDFSKPISLAFRDLKQLEKFAIIPKSAKKLIEKFLPGALTLILPAKLPLDRVLGGDKIGVRIPNDKVAQALLQEIKFPITATSANLSGEKNPVTAQDAMEQIGDMVDLVLDAEKCKYGKPSTVVDCSFDSVEIVREGVISREEILEIFKCLR